MSILGERFYQMSNAVYCYGLSSLALAVYGYLRCRAGSKDTCWPSMQTIASACSCSANTARKAVDELERRGFIRRVPTYATDQKGRRRQSNNTYYLLPFPPLPTPKNKLTYHEEGAGNERAKPGPPSKPSGAGSMGRGGAAERAIFCPTGAEMSDMEPATTKAG